MYGLRQSIRSGIRCGAVERNDDERGRGDESADGRHGRDGGRKSGSGVYDESAYYLLSECRSEPHSPVLLRDGIERPGMAFRCGGKIVGKAQGRKDAIPEIPGEHAANIIL